MVLTARTSASARTLAGGPHHQKSWIYTAMVHTVSRVRHVKLSLSMCKALLATSTKEVGLLCRLGAFDLV